MRGGLLLGAAAYALWGASALYWPLLLPAGTTEILAVRIVWSFVALAFLVSGLGRWRAIHAIGRGRGKTRRYIVAAALLTVVNWGTFIYATTHGRVIEASLGYFISPLVMVALAVLAFRERPRPRQWVAVGLGATGVVVLVVAQGRVPWVALTLAVTFGLYAAVKKQSRVRSVDSLTLETAVLLAPALGYAVSLQVLGTASFGHVSPVHTLLMVGASLVMVVPLLLFGAAANRAPLTTVGLLQYVEPIVQFLIGLLVFNESMPGPRWAAFVLVWAAVAVLFSDRHGVPGEERPTPLTDSEADR